MVEKILETESSNHLWLLLSICNILSPIDAWASLPKIILPRIIWSFRGHLGKLDNGEDAYSKGAWEKIIEIWMGWSTVSKRVVFDKAVFVFFFYKHTSEVALQLEGLMESQKDLVTVWINCNEFQSLFSPLVFICVYVKMGSAISRISLLIIKDKIVCHLQW